MLIDLRKVLKRTKWLGLLLLLALLLTSKWFWRKLYPFPYQEMIFKYAQEYEVDPYLVAAIIREESHFVEEAESYRGARGIMQIMPETGKWAAEQMNLEGFQPDDLYDPKINIKIGCWYLADLSKEFGNDKILMIAAYNAGRGNVKQWIQTRQWSGRHETVEDIPFPETREYVKRVLKGYEKYRWIYGEG